ncbi:MAG: hypothetical protein LUF30_12335 [Lachnospiraceae bacterium]|nr:hypothetical protein [Lachnospiraceae bacterium]
MSVIYDEQTRALAFADVAQDILRGAQNELYLNMRFLDVALSSLAFLPDSQIRTSGTDGSVFYFQPDQLTVVFRKGRELVNRLYLHSILHCLFAHLWVKGDRDKKYWNLACDIAVEYVIDHLYIRAVHHPMSALRREFYRAAADETNASYNTNSPSFSSINQPGKSVDQTGASSDAFAQSLIVSENHFATNSPAKKAADTSAGILKGRAADTSRSALTDDRFATDSLASITADTSAEVLKGTSAGSSRPALTAQRIYRYLCQIHLVDSQIDQLQREFAVDDHSRWAANSDSDDAHRAPTPQSDSSSAYKDKKPY